MARTAIQKILRKPNREHGGFDSIEFLSKHFGQNLKTNPQLAKRIIAENDSVGKCEVPELLADEILKYERSFKVMRRLSRSFEKRS